MTTTLITGANKGLGKEAARRLIAAGHIVWIGARDEQRGRAAAAELGARFVQIDVTDDASVDSAAGIIAAQGGIDVLINNAGIEPRREGNAIPTPADESPSDVLTTFQTNVFGLIRVTAAFLPQLERSHEAVIVNVASGLGSLNGLADPESPTRFYTGLSYPASKATVNALTIQYAKAYPSIRINSVEPGFTSTDLNGHAGIQTVEEGAAVIVEMAQVTHEGPTGTFRSSHGILPW